MLKDEKIQVLTELGLTLLQARIYLALVSLEEPTAAKVAGLSKVARQEVYRIIDELKEAGLVSTIVAAPTIFKPLPFAEGISVLLKRQMEQTAKLRKTVGKILGQKTIESKEELVVKYRFEMVPKKAPWFKKNYLRFESYKEFDLLTSFKRFSSRVIYDQHVFGRAAKKGTAIRILTEKPPAESRAIPIINNLRRYPNFEIRFLRSFFKVVLVIMDGNEVALALTPADRVGPPYLVSNHPSFVHMAQHYFELRWKEALEV